ncbi:MAG: protein-tyrosine phosphatase family protein [Chloroflexota bacterium]
MNDASASLDPPLRVDWLGPDGEPERVGLTILPGKHGNSARYPGRVYRRDVERDLATLVELEVRHLILLVEDSELQRWGNLDIVERGSIAGVQIHRFPMVDGGTPRDLGEMQEILDTIRLGRRDGNVAVACMGGVGRTGMVAACHLVERGTAPRDAIATVRAVRHPEAVETHAQEQFVLRYAELNEAAPRRP